MKREEHGCVLSACRMPGAQSLEWDSVVLWMVDALVATEWWDGNNVLVECSLSSKQQLGMAVGLLSHSISHPGVDMVTVQRCRGGFRPHTVCHLVSSVCTQIYQYLKDSYSGVEAGMLLLRRLKKDSRNTWPFSWNAGMQEWGQDTSEVKEES